MDEAYKFLELLWKGDILCIESLFIDSPNSYQTNEWKELKKFRNQFAYTRVFLSKYIGLARKQALYTPINNVEWVNLWRWLFELQRVLIHKNQVLLHWDINNKTISENDKTNIEFLNNLVKNRPVNAEAKELLGKAQVLLQELEVRFKDEQQHEIENATTFVPNQVAKAVVNNWLITVRKNILRVSLNKN